MDQSGEYRIPAARTEVWRALNDPDTLKRCIVGCQSMVKRDDGGFAAVVKARVGPVRATFNAVLDLADIDPPEGYRINVSVTGGPAGFAKGSATVKLAAVDDETMLRYSATGNIGGKLAQVGSRLVDGAARKMADDFFRAFQVEMSSREPDSATRPHPEPAALSGDPADEGESTADRSAGWKTWAAVAVVSIMALVSASGGIGW